MCEFGSDLTSNASAVATDLRTCLCSMCMWDVRACLVCDVPHTHEVFTAHMKLLKVETTGGGVGPPARARSVLKSWLNGNLTETPTGYHGSRERKSKKGVPTAQRHAHPQPHTRTWPDSFRAHSRSTVSTSKSTSPTPDTCCPLCCLVSDPRICGSRPPPPRLKIGSAFRGLRWPPREC